MDPKLGFHPPTPSFFSSWILQEFCALYIACSATRLIRSLIFARLHSDLLQSFHSLQIITSSVWFSLYPCSILSLRSSLIMWPNLCAPFLSDWSHFCEWFYVFWSCSDLWFSASSICWLLAFYFHRLHTRSLEAIAGNSCSVSFYVDAGFDSWPDFVG